MMHIPTGNYAYETSDRCLKLIALVLDVSTYYARFSITLLFHIYMCTLLPTVILFTIENIVILYRIYEYESGI